MKATFIAVLACVYIAGLTHGQNQPPNNPGDMTTEAFTAQAKTASTGGERAALAAVAFRSQNLELILACFREPGMFGSFIDELEKLPPTEIRSKVAKKLLTESWPQDKSPQGVSPPGSAPPPRLESFCLAEIVKMIPSVDLDPVNIKSVEKLRDKSFRVKLAQLIDANIKTPRHELPDSPDNRDGPGESDKAPHQVFRESPQSQPPAPRGAPAAKPTPLSAPSEEPTSSTPWNIIVVLIVAAIGLLWLLLKRRS